MLLVGRFIRFLIALVFFALGYAVAQFANGNREVISISITPYAFQVPVYLLALVPLGAGLALGWLYTVPARTHEFADHWRSWRAVRRMEKENRELRRSLDRVLEMPEEQGQVARERPAPKAASLAAPVDAEPVDSEVHHVAEPPKPVAGAARGLKAAGERPARVKAARARPRRTAGNGHVPAPAPEPVPAS